MTLLSAETGKKGEERFQSFDDPGAAQANVPWVAGRRGCVVLKSYRPAGQGQADSHGRDVVGLRRKGVKTIDLRDRTGDRSFGV